MEMKIAAFNIPATKKGIITYKNIIMALKKQEDIDSIMELIFKLALDEATEFIISDVHQGTAYLIYLN
jgi:hypothetical protein